MEDLKYSHQDDDPTLSNSNQDHKRDVGDLQKASNDGVKGCDNSPVSFGGESKRSRREGSIGFEVT